MFGSVLGGILAGLALGMLGAGGTVVGLPMLLYLGSLHGHIAFGTNALGVTIIAFVLVLWRMSQKQINLGLGVVFAIPGLVGIAIGARLGLIFPASKLIFLLSFLILIVGGWIAYLSMRQDDPAPPRQGPIERRQIIRLTPVAFITGVISGFFAIGGGFLIVPGLAIAAMIDLRASARSSLLPIAAFAGLDAIEYIYAGDVSYSTSGVMVLAGIAGGAAGILLSNRLPLRVIQRLFAIFLTLVAIYMIVQHL